MDLKFLDSCY